MGYLLTICIAFILLAGGLDSPDSEQVFWSYQPLRRANPPATLNIDWPSGAIDQFILARLEQSGRRPARAADRATLMRRLHFDLIGLPPSIDEIDAFLNDRSPQAIATVVDRLLDSPHFGERWGRHWLDMARYADSSGGGRSLLFQNAWRYRDYVINAFNQDRPFNQFVREQIAGDLLPSANDDERAERFIATAFLIIGPHNYELQDKEQLRMDVVDEQIEAVGRAFLGQTLSCARCHDHKFDPIPTMDYYALAGIFRSTKSLTPGNVSGFEQHELPVSPERRAAIDGHAIALKEIQSQLDVAKNELKYLQASANSGHALQRLIGQVVDDVQATIVGNWTKSKHNPGYVGDGYIHDGASGKGEKSVTFHVDLPQDGLYEVRLSYTHGANRSPSVPITVHHADDQETVQVDERQPPPIDETFVALGRWRFRKGPSDAAVISNEGTTGHVIVDAIQFIPVELLERDEKSAREMNGTAQHAQPPSTQVSLQEATTKVKRLEAKFKKLKESAPPPAPLTMGVKDEKNTEDFRVCIRGDVHNLGQEVRRGFLSVASQPDQAGPRDSDPIATARDRSIQSPSIASGESGRRELADWLVSHSNPLTPRVTVNRIWSHLFGAGLVRTSDNFGSTGEQPSHPELLDWLALRFIELGWSHKKLIREIVLSRSYQMASRPDPASEAPAAELAASLPSSSDPENRLLAYQNRKRLDAECLRDSILSVSGQLDLQRGGPAIREKTDSEYGYRFDSKRRSVYSPVFRNNLPDILEVFDFANPNTPTGRREVSTLPSQALYLMNSPMVMESAQRAAEAILEWDLPDEQRVILSYRRVLGRPPTTSELGLSIAYLQDTKPDRANNLVAHRVQAWSRFYQSLIASVDFRYLH
jgi:hypothetical protein